MRQRCRKVRSCVCVCAVCCTVFSCVPPLCMFKSHSIDSTRKPSCRTVQRCRSPRLSLPSSHHITATSCSSGCFFCCCCVYFALSTQSYFLYMTTVCVHVLCASVCIFLTGVSANRVAVLRPYRRTTAHRIVSYRSFVRSLLVVLCPVSFRLFVVRFAFLDSSRAEKYTYFIGFW